MQRRPWLDRRLFLGILAGQALAVHARGEDDDFDPMPLDAEVASRYALYAMLASNAYHRADRVRFPLERLGWQQVDMQGRPTREPTYEDKDSGLAFDIHHHTGRGESIFAFRGTDDRHDFTHANLAVWPFPGQYQQAREYFQAYASRLPGRKFTLTGHSLGGGLALGVSVSHGHDAVVFNSSPRVFDGLGDNYADARRVMVYEGGEFLSAVRKLWKRKFLHIVPRENIYRAAFEYERGVNRHRSDQLALGLLRLGAMVDSDLAGVLGVLPG